MQNHSLIRKMEIEEPQVTATTKDLQTATFS